jgi:hypothetical protein
MIDLRTRCVFAASALLVAASGAWAGSTRGVKEGYFLLKDTQCASKAGKKAPACSAPVQSCLKVSDREGQKVHLEVYNPQASGHVCGINGSAVVMGDKIRYVDQDASHKEWVLDIAFKADTVVFSYVKPPEGISPFCGEHARLDGLTLKAVRQKSSSKTCFEG